MDSFARMKVSEDISKRWNDAWEKHGDFLFTPTEGASVVCEEVFESLESAMVTHGVKLTQAANDGKIGRLYNELLDVAVTSMRALIGLKENFPDRTTLED